MQVRFVGTETVTLGVRRGAATHNLTLSFTPKVVDITETDLAGRIGEIETYLEAVFLAAESAASVGARLFAKPRLQRLKETGKQAGRLILTVAAQDTTGPMLEVTSIAASVPGADALDLSHLIPGTMPVWATIQLKAYLDIAMLRGQEAKGDDYTKRRLDEVNVGVDFGTAKLTTTIPIRQKDGGPGAIVTLVSGNGLGSLYNSAASHPNSATTFNTRNALRDRHQFYTDAFSTAMDAWTASGRSASSFPKFHCALILPVDVGKPDAADPNAPFPWELWNVTPADNLDRFRGAENMTTVRWAKDDKVQLQSAWALIFLGGGKADIALTCHELGHAIGFRDLYFEENYRDEIAYLGDWAMMNSHGLLPHHVGYHKQQAGWIPDSRVLTIRPVMAGGHETTEFLLVPVEQKWRDSLPGSARSAFGITDPNFAVVQLAKLDLGGDGLVYDLIEARQPGVQFSKSLPSAVPSILITNALDWPIDERFASNDFFRRELHLLNPHNILQNKNDRFDLAQAPEFAAKGIVVTVVERKLVEGDANVFHMRVERENAEFIDLYFSGADPYYENPDLWVDWPVDGRKSFPPGQPRDQGDEIRVPGTGEELHLLVARIRNRGAVKAVDVQLSFKSYVPPGAGDRSKALGLLGEITIPEIAGGNVATEHTLDWKVPAGFSGHTCLMVEVKDFKIPRDSSGVVLGSDDVRVANNHAQKNVSKTTPLRVNPFEPVEFDYAVTNEGPVPERCYLEPDGLAYGMTLTVTPARAIVSARGKVIFRCKLEVDSRVIDAGCQSDSRFRLNTWSTPRARLGGAESRTRCGRGSRRKPPSPATGTAPTTSSCMVPTLAGVRCGFGSPSTTWTRSGSACPLAEAARSAGRGRRQ